MPRDIRSYFTSNKPTQATSGKTIKSRKRAIISDSDDEESEAHSPVKRSKLTERNNKKADVSIGEVHVEPVRNAKKAKLVKDGESEKKLISSTEMFGKGPIQREEGVKVKKKSQKKEAKGEVNNDDDFETALIHLDTSQLEENIVEHVKESKKNDLNGKKYNENEKKKDGKQKKSHSPKKKSSPATTPQKRKFNHKNVSPRRNHSDSTSSPKKTSKRYIDDDEPPSKKIAKKESASKTTEMDPYEEAIQKRKQGIAMYQQYLHRGGARNPGSKQIPQGAEYCLAGLSFVVTGVLDSLEREEAEELIKKYGGRIVHQVSRKTDYVVVGDQAGPSKIAKAQGMNIKMISEDDLLDLIRTRPKGDPDNVIQSRTKSKEREDAFLDKETDSKLSSAKSEENLVKKTPEKPTVTKWSPKKLKGEASEKPLLELNDAPLQKEVNEKSTGSIEPVESTEALVEKYRPKSIRHIVGQMGERSSAKKLYNWLSNWHKNQHGPVKPTKPSPWAKNDDGSFFKAALLSGPPGVGKTTTVQVVCKELGFDLIEFNASDTRSKKLLESEVEGILSNSSIKRYYSGKDGKSEISKHALLMDEVDGMAGNEDRGGLQQLISLIKSTEVPIICICNDRNNPKMRTLANYTYDLRFTKPRTEQIRAAMKSICYKENIEISTEELDRLIISTNHDIRQVINHLALIANNKKTGVGQEVTTNNKKRVNKDLKLGPWDIVRKVFSVEEHKSMSIHDKSDLFFHDYNIVPLFVQENYLSVTPKAPKNEWLDRVGRTANSLAMGDVVEKTIRNNNKWSLLPLQASYCTVIPGTMMSGFIHNQINFPGWFGRNSKRSKFDRLAQEIAVHVHLTAGASKDAINLDYLKQLRNAIIKPLADNGSDGINTAVAIMNNYHLLREDLDSLIEISLWPGEINPLQKVDSKVLAAFTRTYNKKAVLPYIVNGGGNKVKKQAQTSEDFLAEEETIDNSDEEDDDNLETDKMVKAKKPSSSKRNEAAAKKMESSNKKTSSTSKRGGKQSKRGGAANKRGK